MPLICRIDLEYTSNRCYDAEDHCQDEDHDGNYQCCPFDPLTPVVPPLPELLLGRLIVALLDVLQPFAKDRICAEAEPIHLDELGFEVGSVPFDILASTFARFAAAGGK